MGIPTDELGLVVAPTANLPLGRTPTAELVSVDAPTAALGLGIVPTVDLADFSSEGSGFRSAHKDFGFAAVVGRLASA